MTKAYSRFLTALFCLFLGGLMVWQVLLPDPERSDVENRTLAQWPEFSWESLKDGSYTAAVEEYFADQFPLRDAWTGLKARTEQLIGKTAVAILNLPPRKMMGIPSCGMLISAVHKERGEEKLHLLLLDDAIPAGAKLC